MKDYSGRETLTPRERDEFEQEKEIARLQADYQLKAKEMDLAVKRLEVKWTQLFRLPLALLTLPVRLTLCVGYIACCIRGQQPDDHFWDYLTKL